MPPCHSGWNQTRASSGSVHSVASPVMRRAPFGSAYRIASPSANVLLSQAFTQAPLTVTPAGRSSEAGRLTAAPEQAASASAATILLFIVTFPIPLFK